MGRSRNPRRCSLGVLQLSAERMEARHQDTAMEAGHQDTAVEAGHQDTADAGEADMTSRSTHLLASPVCDLQSGFSSLSLEQSLDSLLGDVLHAVLDVCSPRTLLMLEATSVCWRDRIRCVLRDEQWARNNGLSVGWAASARALSSWLVIHPPKGLRRQPRNGGKLLTCIMLQLQYCPLDAAVLHGVAAVLAFSKRLKKLQLSWNIDTVGPRIPVAIAKPIAFNTTLNELRIRSNGIDDEGAATIANALKTNTALYFLDLSHNQIREAGAAAISDALRLNAALKTLRMEFNSIGDVGAKAIGDEVLAVNITLTSLYLSSNSVSNAGAAAISQALEANTALSRLSLSSNAIGDNGAAAIFEALKVNTTLKLLSLFGNRIGIFGAAAIGEAIRLKGTVLTHLYLDCTVKNSIRTTLGFQPLGFQPAIFATSHWGRAY